MLELLTPAEMAEADRLTIAAGTPGIVLMEVAGRAVADAVAGWHVETPVVVVCGPGNNGGDGFVAARLLVERGYRVQLGLLGSSDRLKGDAALAAAGWRGGILPVGALDFAGAGVIIDALFGAGLDRVVAGEAAEAIAAINASTAHVVAVDLPSGIQGETGQVMGVAVRADETVTFFLPKPGQVLMPGRAHVGRLTVADIGISRRVLKEIRPRALRNRPRLWLPAMPAPKVDGHKYDRGHAVIVSGGMTQTGAARLAARAALRAGAGLVTLASPPDALAVNAAHLTAIMLKRIEGGEGLAALLADTRLNSVGLGPGLGPVEVARPLVEAALRSEAAVVIDADGLSAFHDASEHLFAEIRSRSAPVVLTPHDGEFARLFPDLAALPGKLDRARQAAARSGAIVLLKGADTTVADPEGRAAIADNAPPYLATAGSGDVLAGMIVGLLAERMPAFEATAASIWLHGDAGAVLGRGLIAEDLADALPRVFTRLFV
ncbi:NAD(P)H-hydrate dehydratase [Kaistia granuli]|uniref:NAD(P)H-hydrate dehydratase n=1 Tax=Kaistia granuli TaxID=363259 RepID=UPI003CCB8C28